MYIFNGNHRYFFFKIEKTGLREITVTGKKRYCMIQREK
jgi:hypothetical protein